MARVPRLVVPGIPCHITHRGNNKQNIFHDTDDRLFYLNLLRKYSYKYDLDILGYCLMTNHVHIVGIPGNKNSLARVIGLTHMIYAQITNLKYNREDHLWSERFKSFPFDESYSMLILGYIELNPVRAGITELTSSYKWSSALAHVSGIDTENLINMKWWHERFDCESWKSYLENQINSVEINIIRECTQRNLPLGNTTSSCPHYISDVGAPVPPEVTM